ncbi:MAG TPA: vitamin K epoxide reductase family protein [Candidatus Rubrimentiphilum sp.]|nr:vitamin K epoxide reductase family protein [Candidatus Rubrimentiphilum sp.]
MLPLQITITVLCAAGFYASVFMERKSIAAEHGEVKGPSVVKSPRARLFAGIPNALIGCIYYPLIAAVAWAAHTKAIFILAEAAALLAAGTSIYLAYSLLLVTRRNCPYCWTAHAANWLLAIALLRWLV